MTMKQFATMQRLLLNVRREANEIGSLLLSNDDEWERLIGFEPNPRGDMMTLEYVRKEIDRFYIHAVREHAAEVKA